MGHYQFETLHRFNDGNGRLGRLVALVQLIISGDLRSLVMNLSPWLKEHQQEYQQDLFDLSATGSFDRWIEFFSMALIAHGQEAVRRVSDLLVLRQELIDEVNRSPVRGTAARLAADLIGYPMLTTNTVRDLCGVSAQAANTAVSRLADLGILRQSRQVYPGVLRWRQALPRAERGPARCRLCRGGYEIRPAGL